MTIPLTINIRKLLLGGFLLLTLLASGQIRAGAAEDRPDGEIIGRVVDPETRRGTPFATVTLKVEGGRIVATTATDAEGRFKIPQLPPDRYTVSYSLLGGSAEDSGPVLVDAAHRTNDVGALALHSSVVKMAAVEVKTSQSAALNAIDRKVYLVGKDIQSAAGSASDLLQNVPSVQVDIDGNVSLRGDSSVLILIDGKPSSMLSTANRPDVLQQMPADSIEKIEVITNPSAKYKPDGTSGIINITLKRQKNPGYSGSVRASVGNNSRYNFSVSGNYRPGKYNLSLLASVRQDDRLRYNTETRSHVDATTGATIATFQQATEHMRPLSRLLQAGANYSATKQDQLDLNLQYNLRTFDRTSTTSNATRDLTGSTTLDYDRFRVDPESQHTESIEGAWRHRFAEDDHELTLNAKQERHAEQESNHYTNRYRTPIQAPTFDDILLKPTDTTTEVGLEYNRPVGSLGKMESGYIFDHDIYDTDLRGGYFDPAANALVLDLSRTNYFTYQDYIHAFYATYARVFGRLAAQAGLRLEQTFVDTDQVTSHLVAHQNYARVHPSLHLTYSLTDTQQVQLNYSHRIRRPESDDLNPFPAYQDPFNLRAGNPRLLPAETHSLETGYQYHQDETSYSGTVYYRNTYHSFTQVTRYIDSVTLLTTQENLSTSQSSGLEITANHVFGPLTAVFSGNAYRNQIDASNLGLSSSRSTVTWESKLNLFYRYSKATQVELNTNYAATRLTAQGERRPTYITNIGIKHDLRDKRFSVILTVSDIFNTLKEETVINTATLRDDTIRRRSSRIIYAGLNYTFGKATKKSKDDALKFDTVL